MLRQARLYFGRGCGGLQNTEALWSSDVFLWTAGRLRLHLNPGPIDIPSIPAWFFVCLREFGGLSRCKRRHHGSFCRSSRAVSVWILVGFEERRFSSGTAGQRFIFGCEDQNNDVEENKEGSDF